MVIDKGLLDAIACGNPSSVNIGLMLSEVHRVLNEEGTYFCITRNGDKKRKKHLKNIKKYNWKVHKTLVQQPAVGQANARPMRVPDFDDTKNFHFIYRCAKQVDKVVDTDEEQMEEEEEEEEE